MRTIWEEVKGQIRKEIPEKGFSLWINPITQLEQKKDSLILCCPNKFSLNWVTENYKTLIEDKLDSISNGNNKLVLKVQTKKRTKPLPPIFNETKQLTLPNVPSSRNVGRRRFKKEFTFDRFVVGNCNEFAYSAAKAMALGTGWSYDSLFMLSKTGLGKSHLSQSVGHAIREQDPKIRAYYITAEDFVNEMVFAIRNNRIDEFKNRYRRSCDVLMLEEVHFLSGKEKTQLELGFTLDALINDNKKIIFTSSMLPKDIPNINKELSSRLTSGVITTLERPDFNTRVEILEKKAIEQNLSLSEELTHFLAKHLTRDVRQIESALRCLQAKSELMKEKIDLSLAKEVIKCQVSEQGIISLSSIRKLICKYFKIEPVMLRSKSRKKIHSYPRNIYAYLCRHHTDATLEDIGKSIDRNHSTVLYASEVIERKKKIDNKVRNELSFLNKKLKEIAE
jgi:chromosomal replication initiator protein